MNSFLSQLIRTVAIFFLAVSIIFLAIAIARNFEQFNKNEALQGCYTAARATYVDKSGSTVSEVIKSQYKTCVEDKGYTTSIQ